MTSPYPPLYRFVPPPNWPPPPDGWVPPPGWQPDPAWGPAPEGWPFWQAVTPAPAEPPVDGFAIATLVAGIAGSLIFAAIFGGVSLSRIRRGLRRGRNLVITGWVLTALWLVGVLGVLVWISAQAPVRAPDGTTTRAGRIAPMRLQVGDCVELPESARGTVLQVDVVPCSSPHNAQLFAVVALDPGSYPGDDQAVELGLSACTGEVAGLLGKDARIAPGLHVFSFTAAEPDWKRGDRTARCLLLDTTGDFTGDVRDR